VLKRDTIDRIDAKPMDLRWFCVSKTVILWFYEIVAFETSMFVIFSVQIHVQSCLLSKPMNVNRKTVHIVTTRNYRRLMYSKLSNFPQFPIIFSGESSHGEATQAAQKLRQRPWLPAPHPKLQAGSGRPLVRYEHCSPLWLDDLTIIQF